MGKIEQIFDSLLNLTKSKDSDYKYLLLVGSRHEDTLGFDTNFDSNELAILLYDLCKRSKDLRLAIRAVSCQLDNDTSRRLEHLLGNSKNLKS